MQYLPDIGSKVFSRNIVTTESQTKWLRANACNEERPTFLHRLFWRSLRSILFCFWSDVKRNHDGLRNRNLLTQSATSIESLTRKLLELLDKRFRPLAGFGVGDWLAVEFDDGNNVSRSYS
jgi:hypothetical protein